MLPLLPVGTSYYRDPLRAPSLLSLDELARLTDAQLAAFDIAELHLRCAEGLPGAEGLDIPACLQALDNCADAVRIETAQQLPLFDHYRDDFNNSKAVFRCAILSAVLHNRFHIVGNVVMNEMDDVTFLKESRNCFIHGVINGYPGSCLPLAVLYIAVGRRLGYPLKLVRTVDHAFARWEDANERFNIETGMEDFASPPDAHYREWPVRITEEEANTQHHLRSMTPREELAQFFFHRGYCLAMNGRSHEMGVNLFRGHDLAPDDPCLIDSIVKILAAWRIGLTAITPPWFAPIDIVWPKRRRLPERVPIKVEREFLLLGIWEQMLRQPRWQSQKIIPPSGFRFPPVLVRCE